MSYMCTLPVLGHLVYKEVGTPCQRRSPHPKIKSYQTSQPLHLFSSGCLNPTLTCPAWNTHRTPGSYRFYFCVCFYHMSCKTRLSLTCLPRFFPEKIYPSSTHSCVLICSPWPIIVNCKFAKVWMCQSFKNTLWTIPIVQSKLELWKTWL